MKEKIKEFLGWLFVAGFIIAIVLGLHTSGYSEGYQKGHKEAVDKMWNRMMIAEEEASGLSSSLSSCHRRIEGLEEVRDEMIRFNQERCVCVLWSTGTEEPLTKNEICNWPCDKGDYSEKEGYCNIDYWEPKDENN